jgi:hypothetical protein
MDRDLYSPAHGSGFGVISFKHRPDVHFSILADVPKGA